MNAKGTLAFANVDGLVGFEVGDLQTGLILDSVAAEGYDKDAAAKYECPSHGIAFTPDERELWVADGVRNRLQVFDASVYPPVALDGGRTARSASMDRVQHRWPIRISFDRRRDRHRDQENRRRARRRRRREGEERALPRDRFSGRSTDPVRPSSVPVKQAVSEIKEVCF